MIEIISLINARYLCGGDSIKQLRQVSWKHFFMLDALPNRDVLKLFNRLKEYSRLVINSDYTLVDERSLLAVHGILNEDAISAIRNSQNLVGSSHAQIAIFVPPPPDQVRGLLDNYFFATVRSTNSLCIEEVIQIYSNFLKIHPFSDGNGRVARVIFDCLLRKCRPDILVSPLLYRLYHNDLYRDYVKFVGDDYSYTQYTSLPFWKEAIKYAEISSAKCKAVMAASLNRSASNVIAFTAFEYSLLNQTKIFPIVRLEKARFNARAAFRSDSLSLYYEENDFVYVINKKTFKLWLDLEKEILPN